MTDTSDAPDLGTVLRRIGLLTRGWPGESLDDAGSLRLVNPEGGAVPVYWTFNSFDEFPALMAQMSADRPLVGLRSLNKVVSKDERDGCAILDDLAGHFAERLVARFGARACIVGGNCQAASLAYRIALRLLEAGVPVQQLVTLDAEWHLPLPVPVRMIFGQKSRFNPLISQDHTVVLRKTSFWSAIFPGFETRVTDGDHGQYFKPGNVDRLARIILEPVAQTDMSPSGLAANFECVGCVDGKITLKLDGRSDPDQLELAAFLWRDGATPIMRAALPTWIAPGELHNGGLDFTLQLPDDTSTWNVRPILCRRGVGPLTWPFDRQPVFRCVRPEI